MLVLTRRVGEEIAIIIEGKEQVTITLAEAWPGKARLGFDAAPNVRIMRTELLEGN